MDEEHQVTRKCYPYQLLRNVQKCLPLPKTNAAAEPSVTAYTKGDFSYFHYNCDGFKDLGWGCAYRTLQSICSWIAGKRGATDVDVLVPSIKEIQQTLVQIGDKENDFVGSHDWIGAIEVFYFLDALYDVVCRIIHIASHEDLKKYANVLKKYFDDYGGLVMMGGDMDAGSKGIAGIHISGNQVYLLVIDPHFSGVPKSVQELVERGYIRWQHTSEFVDSSFYNICLPQLK
ncbi:probable Ufm1-specific protease 1 [Bactrocera neohumeralis]|uniref:probable Ufm1-specific protease 1 n=1 Tax=Bactrocera tryoni TaxID=59916 RepID=UPI001A96B051|nr:probable Ufm1-specific protease 1 [Bactrocera tryoni]XP_050322955.1 probable Ufm1-specific protease 1 [Bactrocera neohumeralis]